VELSAKGRESKDGLNMRKDGFVSRSAPLVTQHPEHRC